MDSDGSEKGPETEFCEHGNEKVCYGGIWHLQLLLCVYAGSTNGGMENE